MLLQDISVYHLSDQILPLLTQKTDKEFHHIYRYLQRTAVARVLGKQVQHEVSSDNPHTFLPNTPHSLLKWHPVNSAEFSWLPRHVALAVFPDFHLIYDPATFLCHIGMKQRYASWHL